MKTNPKIIGSNFEREFSKKLSLKVSNNKKDNIFWRTPSSGSIGYKGFFYQGDITLIDKNYKWDYIVECKSLKNASIIPLTSNLKKIIQECDKRYIGEKWLLALKIRKYGIFIISNLVIEGNEIDGIIEVNKKRYYVYNFEKIQFRECGYEI